MVRSNSVPDSTLGRPWACTAQLDLGHSPRPAMAPPAASPCTKRRRDGLSSPSTARPKESNDMDNSGKRQKTRLGASGKGLAQSADRRAVPCSTKRRLADRAERKRVG